MKKKRDITGQTFGRLTAEYPVRFDKNSGTIWHCRCSCGGEKDVPLSRLSGGRTTSCGCIRAEARERLDITGQTFGRLTAVKFLYYNEKSQDVWRFRCECGTEKDMPASNVKWSRVQSCGCLYRDTRVTCAENRYDAMDGTFLTQLIAAKEVRCDNTSGHTGVCYNQQTGKWAAYINFRKKRYFLGRFSSYEKAVEARIAAEHRLHDPIIEEQWEALSEDAKKRFLERQTPAAENDIRPSAEPMQQTAEKNLQPTASL